MKDLVVFSSHSATRQGRLSTAQYGNGLEDLSHHSIAPILELLCPSRIYVPFLRSLVLGCHFISQALRACKLVTYRSSCRGCFS